MALAAVARARPGVVASGTMLAIRAVQYVRMRGIEAEDAPLIITGYLALLINDVYSGFR